MVWTTTCALGNQVDTRWNQGRLKSDHDNFDHYELDIRDRQEVCECIEQTKPDLVVHTAAQPSHDLAASRPFGDFDVNAVGTFNLIEATRLYASDAVFVHMGTNKVYGDKPNTIKLKELDTRWDYDDPAYEHGIAETFSIDQSKHSLFGASKVAGDICVQEYGRYFDMKTCFLRGGCLTGQNGKQVRDNTHSLDVARFIHSFYENPRCGEVYNIGGGGDNRCSILEAFERAAALSVKTMDYEYLDDNRAGDHICYLSDLRKMREHFPNWDLTKSLDDSFEEIHQAWVKKGD